MQFAEYFICPFCYANTGVSTTLGKVSFGTDELRVKEMFHNMPTMKVSTVPQLFYTDGSSRHGYFRTILNAKCQECGREVLSKTVIRDVFITFVRNMTRNFLHELDLEPTAKFKSIGNKWYIYITK